MDQRYSESANTIARTHTEWVRTLGSTEAFDAAIRNGHLDEVSTLTPETIDAPPYM